MGIQFQVIIEQLKGRTRRGMDNYFLLQMTINVSVVISDV